MTPDQKWTAGQEVVLSGGRWNAPKIVKIEKVTPTGRPRVQGVLFREDGVYCRAYTVLRIEPVTDEWRERIARRDAWERLRALVKFDAIPTHLDSAAIQAICEAIAATPEKP